MTPKKTFGWRAGVLALLVALVAVEPVVAQDVFFTQSGGRGLQNAKSNARISKVETDIGVIKDDLKTIQPFARREIPSCDSTGAKLLWRRDNWSCDDETDPTVQPFAKKALPVCGAGQILAASGSEFSCANSGYLSAESDPTVQGFAKAALPSCSSGSVLSAVNGALKCVSDNAGLTAETDPLVYEFAKTTTATIENCDAGEVLKMTNNRLECVADQGITAETDPRVQAFARNDTTGALLTACAADHVLVAETSGGNVVLTCKAGGTALAGVLSAQTLAGLADVGISGPGGDEVLRYDGSKWVNSSDKIGTTTDTKWCYFSSNNIVCDRDVPAPMPAAACTSSEIITWDGTAWTCQGISTAIGGALALDDLNDVSITTPISGQGLTYTGSGWENGYNTRIAQGDSDVRVVDGGTGAIQTVVDNGAVMTALANMVGINTVTPNASLDVVGLVSASAFNTSGYVNAALVQGAVVSGSQIHSSGTIVGGGLRSVSDTVVGQDLYVSRNLYVSGSQSIDGVVFANGGVSASGVISATGFAGDGSGLTGVVASSVDKVISGTTRIDLVENGGISFTTAGSQQMVLTAGGLLGIGTSNPTVELEVNGDVSATNLWLSGNLNVSGTQNIDGVVFANGGVSATGIVSATGFSGDGSGLNNVTAADMSWFGLTNVPNPITYVSDSALTAAIVGQLENIGISVLPASVWGNLAYLNQSVSTTSAPTFAGLTLNGDVTALGRYVNLQSGGLISATTGYFGNISATDVHIMGNLYVSGTQSIDGVLFANGGVQATNAITGPIVSASTVNGQYASFTTIHAGNLTGDLSWYSLTNIPSQVQEVSNSGAIVMAGVSATNVSVTSNLTAANFAATTGSIGSLSANGIGAVNISATGAMNSRYVSSTEGFIGNLTAGDTVLTSLTATTGITSDGDLRVRGNLYVSGSQNIEGVLFAQGGIQASNAVTAPQVSATNVSASYVDVTRNGTVSATYGYFTNVSASSYSGNGSGLTGVTANAMSWFGLTNVPNPIAYISDSALTVAEVAQLENIGTSVLPASVWSNLAYLNQSVSTTSAPTFAGLTLNGDVTATGRYVNMQSGGLISATTGNFQYISATEGYLGTAQIASLGAGNVIVTSLTATTGITSDGDLRVRGNLYVSGSQNIEGVLFAQGGIQASNAVTAPQVSATNVSASYVDATLNGTVSATYGYFTNVSSSSYSGDGSGLTGVTASSVAWGDVTSKPASIVSLSVGLTGGLAVNDVVYFDGTDYQTTSATTLLGLGTMAYQNANAVAITGGSIGTVDLLSGTQVYGQNASFTTASIGGLGVENINASGLIATARVSATNDMNTYYLSATTAFIGELTGSLVSATTVNGQYASFTTAGVGGLTASGIVTATYFEGDGSRLTNLNSSEVNAAGSVGEVQVHAADGKLGASSTLVWQSGVFAEPNLKVAGTLQVAGTDDTEACVAGRYGTLRMNPTTGAMEVCRY